MFSVDDIERKAREISNDRGIDFPSAIAEVLDEEIKGNIQQLLSEGVSVEQAEDIVFEAVEQYVVDREKRDLEAAEKNLLESKGPKCMYIAFGGEFGPTKEQAIAISRARIKVQSRFIFHEIDQTGLRRHLFASEEKMDEQRARKIVESLDSDLYTSREVETILCKYTPFDIRT